MANDVIRLTRQDTLRAQLEEVATLAQQRGSRVVLMPSGNVGHAPFFLPPVQRAASGPSPARRGIRQRFCSGQWRAPPATA